MSDFATRGQLGGANGMAALAIARAVLKKLEKSGVFSRDDISAIVADALAQISNENNERSQEVKRLIQMLDK